MMKINEKNLIAYSTSRDHIDKEGYLLKRGEINKAFQRRWFILKGNLLFYFEKKGDKEPIGVIILEGCTTELAESEEYFVFKLIFCGEGSRVYTLAAESQELLESWMKYISRASYDYLKLMVAELQRQLEETEELEKNSDNSAMLSPVSLCSQSATFSKRRENPFNKRDDSCSYSDLWRSGESIQNATSLLNRTSSFTGPGVIGVNTSLPPCVPFRPAPPPPKFHTPTSTKPLRKSFLELHSEYGILILKDKEYYRECKLLHCRTNNKEVQNLIDL